MPLPIFGAGQRLIASDLMLLILKVNQLAAPPGVIVGRVANQVIATGGGGVNVNWDTEFSDSANMVTVPANVITITIPGIYRAGFTGAMGGSGQFYQVTQNGGTVRGQPAGGATPIIITPDFICAAGDTVGVGVFQSSGGNQNFTGYFTLMKTSD